MGSRTSSPSLVGFSPRSDCALIAFSITGISDFSHGLMVMSRASGTLSVAT
jgi:hypothetical protein